MFIGTVWTNYLVVWDENVAYSNRNVITNFNTSGPDVPNLTNIFTGVSYATNNDYYTENFVTDVIKYATNTIYSTNEVYGTLTNSVYEYATNTLLKYAFGITVIKGYPYVGTAPAYIDHDYSWPTNGLYEMAGIYTGLSHKVDIYYNTQTPSNFPPTIPAEDSSPWHGYNSSAPGNWSNYTTVAAYDNFYDGGLPGWVFHGSETNNASIVFGSAVTHGFADLSLYEMDLMLSIYETFYYAGAPSAQSVNLVGCEVTDAIALIYWNVTNGFKYK
jgi:hypothetical protein